MLCFVGLSDSRSLSSVSVQLLNQPGGAVFAKRYIQGKIVEPTTRMPCVFITLLASGQVFLSDSANKKVNCFLIFRVIL